MRNSFGYDVWQDDDETLNSELVDVKDCLENCICMIVCVSKLYMSRLKCKKEVKRAHDLKAMKKLRIFYVFMQDDFTNDSHPHHVDGQVVLHTYLTYLPYTFNTPSIPVQYIFQYPYSSLLHF